MPETVYRPRCLTIPDRTYQWVQGTGHRSNSPYVAALIERAERDYHAALETLARLDSAALDRIARAAPQPDDADAVARWRDDHGLTDDEARAALVVAFERAFGRD